MCCNRWDKFDWGMAGLVAFFAMALIGLVVSAMGIVAQGRLYGERMKDIQAGKLERCDEFSSVSYLPPVCLKRYNLSPNVVR